MGSTVQVGGFEISSSSESAEEMVKALTPEKDKGKEPVVLKDRGQKVEPKPADQEKVTEAARELGKRGGEAAAKAREDKAKEPEKEAKPGEAKPAGAKPVDHSAREGRVQGEATPEVVNEASKKGDPRHDPEARVRVATQQAAEARRHFEEAQARAEELAERLERLEKRLPPEPRPEAEARPQGKPTPEQYDTYEEFTEALTDWKLEQRDQAQQKQTYETAQDARIQKHVSGFRERMGKALQADPDLLQRVDPRLLELQTSFQAHAAGRGIGPGEVLADLYTASEHGPEILLHLTEHPEEVVRLIRCEDPVSLAREFGKIEARIAKAADGETPPPKPTVSKAPPPLTPVGTSATETEPDIFGEISFDEFRRRRKAR